MVGIAHLHCSAEKAAEAPTATREAPVADLHQRREAVADLHEQRQAGADLHGKSPPGLVANLIFSVFSDEICLYLGFSLKFVRFVTGYCSPVGWIQLQRSFFQFEWRPLF